MNDDLVALVTELYEATRAGKLRWGDGDGVATHFYEASLGDMTVRVVFDGRRYSLVIYGDHSVVGGTGKEVTPGDALDLALAALWEAVLESVRERGRWNACVPALLTEVRRLNGK